MIGPRAMYASTHQGNTRPTRRRSYPSGRTPFRRSVANTRRAYRSSCRSRTLRSLVIQPLRTVAVAVVTVVASEDASTAGRGVLPVAIDVLRSLQFRPGFAVLQDSP